MWCGTGPTPPVLRPSGVGHAVGGSWLTPRRVRSAKVIKPWSAACWPSGSGFGPSHGPRVGHAPGSKGSSTACIGRTLRTTRDRPQKVGPSRDRGRRTLELRGVQGRRALGLGGPGRGHSASAGDGGWRSVCGDRQAPVGLAATRLPDRSHGVHGLPRLVPGRDPSLQTQSCGQGLGTHCPHRTVLAHITPKVCTLRAEDSDIFQVPQEPSRSFVVLHTTIQFVPSIEPLPKIPVPGGRGSHTHPRAATARDRERESPTIPTHQSPSRVTPFARMSNGSMPPVFFTPVSGSR